MPPHASFALKGRKVLVTGGTGSIGSEIVRQALAAGAGVVRVFSRDETKQAELAQRLGNARARARFLIGDVRDAARVRRALSEIDVVFHAAAMKHVAACEYNPFEAVQTNVAGTQNVIQAALDAGVGRVVLISTDKAVNPTSTMGATKLVAERIVSAANQWARGTVFATVRFGNVLGSRGSVVPVVEDLVARARAVRINDRTMTRFVMTIRDAVGLVLKAAGLARGGEIFILKMPAVRVEALVRVLVARAARRLGQDVGAVRIDKPQRARGVGEKVDEELLTAEEIERTEETRDFFVVHPAWRVPRSRLWTRPDPARYRSDAARPLSDGEIRRLLDRTGP